MPGQTFVNRGNVFVFNDLRVPGRLETGPGKRSENLVESGL